MSPSVGLKPLALLTLILLVVSLLPRFFPRSNEFLSPGAPAQKALTITGISDNRSDFKDQRITQYEKLEITFQIQNSLAGNFQFPYDPNPPKGIDLADPDYRGISVDGLFLPPGQTDWSKAYRQPGFYYYYYDDQRKLSWDGKMLDWHYPDGKTAWKVRFSPDQSGAWQYRLTAQDAGGQTTSAPRSFNVIPSSNPGFVKVSSSAPRYFEFDNGAPFLPLGIQGGDVLNDPRAEDESTFRSYGENGIRLVRLWISSLYGSAWLEWIGGRNLYDGYLPRAGLETFHDPIRNRDILTLRMDYETGGDMGWYDACRFQSGMDPEAVKPHTNYRLRIEYWGQDIRGTRLPQDPAFGLVGKMGLQWEPGCYDPGANAVITTYGGNTSDWGFIEGTWNSGKNNFVPRIYLGLENVKQGKIYLKSISLREDLGDGRYGPEILREPSLQYEHYIPDQGAYALDGIVGLAEKYGVYLKLVIMEKDDAMVLKLDDDGTYVGGSERDNVDGFYGLGRGKNKTRWLQQAWWRYLQARWGYSTHIHSWEATNEGDPWLVQHYQLVDELGKVMHCEVFGMRVAGGDGQKCSYAHPDGHLVTTSTWHSFPAAQFWMNPKYPNVDYADVHAYISTSKVGLSKAELEQMQWDAAFYHLGHSLALGGLRIGKPVMRGEAGIDAPDRQREQPDLALDRQGVWLHNFLWSTLDSGGLGEIYWWRDNILRQPGPDGQKGLFEVYRYFSDFMADIPIHNGHYEAVGASLTDPNLRLTGQKDTRGNRAHLWIWNHQHTWRNVVDGTEGTSGLTGTVSLGGFRPGIKLNVAWYVFTTQGLPDISYSSITTGPDGVAVLALPAGPQVTDVGIKVGDYEGTLAP